MTDTNTETTTTRFPAWAGKAGLWAAIIVATQVPSLFRTAVAAGKASDHVCEMASQGHSMPVIAKSMKGDRSFNYPKRWEGVAKAILTNNLKSCPAVVAVTKNSQR
mgnify:CR=1 FL=1|tara:strand:+ start:25 stop:342 length:318 start_codon:yes stop_codon:yes gene_type:complete